MVCLCHIFSVDLMTESCSSKGAQIHKVRQHLILFMRCLCPKLATPISAQTNVHSPRSANFQNQSSHLCLSLRYSSPTESMQTLPSFPFIPGLLSQGSREERR